MIGVEIVAQCQSIMREQIYQVFLSRWGSLAKKGCPVPADENEVRRVLRYYDKCLGLLSLLLKQTDAAGLRGTLRMAQQLAGEIEKTRFLVGWADELGKGGIPAVDPLAVKSVLGLRSRTQGIVDRILSAYHRQLSIFEVEGEDEEAVGR
jgi:hypothetical protein